MNMSDVGKGAPTAELPAAVMPVPPGNGGVVGRQLSRGTWVLFDQGLVSLTNFATTVMIGWVGAQALGFYGLIFPLIWALGGIPKALIWTPYTTFSPRMTGEEQLRYTGSVTVHLMGLTGVMALGLALVGGALGHRQFDHWTYQYVLGTLALVLLPMMLREHARRLCLAWMSLSDLILIDLWAGAAQVLGLLTLWKTGRLTGSSAFALIVAANLLVLVWFAWRHRRFEWDWAAIWPSFCENWRFAGWLLSGSVIMFLITLYYRWMLAEHHGLSAVGVVTAIQSIVMFGNPVILGMANYFAPATATTYAVAGRAELVRSVIRSTLVLLAVIAAFLVMLALGGVLLTDLFYAKVNVAQYGGAIVALAGGIFAEQLLIPVECGFMAMGTGRLLFVTSVFRLLITVTAGGWFVLHYGPAGIGYGMMAANLAALVWLWVVFMKQEPARG